MKRRAVVGAVLLALASGCGTQVGTPSPVRAAAPTASPELAGDTAPASDWSPPVFEGSIYDLKVTFTDQQGNRASLDAFRGHPVLVTMFYARCGGACPILTTDLKRIDREVSPATHEKLRVLMVSFDAAHDTPEALSRMSHERGLDPARWKLAAAAEDAARELSAVLGIKYRKLDNGAYFHSSVITLLDEAGKPLVRTEGLGKDPGPILAALK